MPEPTRAASRQVDTAVPAHDDAVVLRRLRASRAALAVVVSELASKGGCTDIYCELSGCWLADQPESEVRYAIEQAIRFINEDDDDG